MPATLSYPGVYIEEIPSGVRTITGVATSITAFAGRALRGPTDEDGAATINSFGDFEGIFGGLWKDSPLGFAVRDFYRNGGSQAVIVRLFKAEPAPTGGGAAPQKYALLSVDGILFRAAFPGKWGAALRITLDVDVSADAAAAMGFTKDDTSTPARRVPDTSKLFNLTVRDTDTGATELHRNLTLVKGKSRTIDRVLKDSSRLLRCPDGFPSATASGLGTNATAAQTAKEAWDNAIKTNAANKATLRTAYEDAAARLADPISIEEAKLAAFLRDSSKTAGERDAQRAVIAKAVQDARDAISDGLYLDHASFFPIGGETNKRGIYALDKVDLFNIVCIPPHQEPPNGWTTSAQVIDDVAAYCERKRAFYIIDSPPSWIDKDSAREGAPDFSGKSKNAALFFPRLRQPDPFDEDRLANFAPCGAIAGVFARTDTQRGVWKAPAGLDASFVAVPQLSVSLTDAENGELNPLGLNCLRAFPASGRVVWGARTRLGDDRLASEWKYIPIRRTALFIEESLYRGTQWVVFEPNDEPLWAQIRLNVGAFMNRLFRQGAFQGTTPKDAYFVKCDRESNPQSDVDLGIVNIVVGFAPLKPAEFVVIKLQQMAGQIET